jgi:tetratricopeptide (TPR) repeat protein
VRRHMFAVVGICLLALASPAMAGSADDEAARQLEFARSELAGENFDRALQSAESALTLLPTAYEAIVIKALAYEGLGEKSIALALLDEYAEVAPSGGARLEAVAARERIEASLRGPGRRRVPQRATTEVQESTFASLDPEVYRGRVVQALGDGRCASARAAAKELLQAMPNEAAGWRLMGDAARCDANSREAVVSYRRFLELGGSDSAVDSMIDGLQGSLATLTVGLELPEEAAVPLLRLLLGDELLVPGSLADGSWRFADLPADVEMLLLVEGRGVRTSEHTVGGLGEGEAGAETIKPEWVGTGRLDVADRPCKDCLVRAWIDGQERTLRPGDSLEVTAGTVDVEVSNAHGSSEVPVSITSRQVTAFDPVAWMPSEMTLIGVPAGSHVDVVVSGFEGAEIDRKLAVPIGVGELDLESGVRVPEPQRIRSLVGGKGEVIVTHPVLGEGRTKFVLEPGAVNATTFNWRTMPGAATARSSFAQWKEDVVLQRRKAATRPLPGVVMAIAGGVAAGVLTGLGVDATNQAGVLDAAYEAAKATESQDQLTARFATVQEKQTEGQRLLGGAAISAGVAGVGGALTVILAASGKKPPRVDDWRLEVR